IHMAHSLGMSAIVEAVESASQVEIVRSFNADAAQGFFFARPMSGENAAELAGSTEVPQFSRTEIRTLVRPGDPGGESGSASESDPVTDGVDMAEGPTGPVETD
ncbi:MAG TPA: EAL domain-containing protein, partial [Acidimicrobiales bacterium]|nr:EAL domain-containing protein [Acidimicrobiales bacterium]